MTEQLIEVNSVKLWTAHEGQGLPLMLCNGGPGCCDYLAPVSSMINDLVEVYRWEQRGCGRSEPVEPYDLATCIEDLEALRRYFGYERWLIGGHSWGANLSLAYALAHPERVQAVVYLAGTGITEDWKPAYHRAEQERSELLPDFAYLPNQEVNRQGNRAWTAYLADPSLPERVRALNVPFLLVQAEKDLRPYWPVEQLAGWLPNARFVLIKEAQHCLWLTHLAELRQALRDFLSDLLVDR